jgi:hypothetical protein
MVNLSAGPPFPHQPGGAGAAAQNLAGKAAAIQAVGGDVTSAHAPAQSSVSGLFSAPMATAPQPALRMVRQTSRSTLFAAGALQLFANAAETYNGTIDRLNEQWSTAESNNFGVEHPYVPGGATPAQASQAQAQYEADVNAARAALRKELRGKQATAEGKLDDAAEEARGMLARGPNGADTNQLVRLGVFHDLLDGLRGQFMPLDESLLGLTLFGAGRGLQALDYYAKYAGALTRNAMRFQPGRVPLTLQELRALRADARRWTRLSTRLLGPGGNLVSLIGNVREDGVVKGTAETAAGLRAAATCARQAVMRAGKSPASLVISGGVAGLLCGVLGEETANRILEDAGEVAEDAVGSPTVEPTASPHGMGMPSFGWDSPEWYEKSLGSLWPG